MRNSKSNLIKKNLTGLNENLILINKINSKQKQNIEIG